MSETVLLFIVGTIISGLSGGFAAWLKVKIDITSLENRMNQSNALMQKDVDNLIKTKDIDNERFEKVLDKLEISIEKLNISQTELVKAISELRLEIKNK